jgi:lactate dehydrogenase-like 2-hydroxyacid dehydrogenase
MNKPFVIITHALPEAWISPIKDECDFFIGSEDDGGFSQELQRNLHRADGLFTLLTDTIDREILNKAVNLKVISNMAVGVDNIDLVACNRLKIPVGHTPGVLTEGTADLTLTILLALARRIPEAIQDAKAGRWTTWSPTGWLGGDLHGNKIGIVGMGKIGQAVARRAHGFGMDIIYNDRSSKPEIEEAFGARFFSFNQLLKISDYICLHVPLTSETRNMISINEFNKMKREAFLINVSRGPVVDTDALVTVLKENKIAGAAIDVTDPEPLPPEHPLYQLPNCLITPHIGSATHNTRRKMAELACNNLLAGLKGDKLPFCVNPEVYDK